MFRPTQDAPPTLSPPADATTAGPRWLAWLTPWRCRLIFAALLAFSFFSNWSYLRNSCQFDLSGDESHYWDWSRQLDLSYYSKGPAVAYIIRFGCWLFGDNMPGVRFPALVLAVGTATITYWLTRRLFKSDRIALGLTVISGCVPAFMAGGILMTIDPPFFFCWGLATLFAALAVLEDKKWAWIGLGVAIGLGSLAKVTTLVWLVGFVLFLILDKPSRKYLKSPWFYAAIVIGLVFLTPIVVWNAKHDWVTSKHIKADTDADFHWGSPFEMLGSQAAILGLSLAAIMVAACVYAFRKEAKQDPHYRAVRFLACIGVTYFGIVFLLSWRCRIQANWPAPAYFSLLILSAYFLSVRFRQPGAWRKWWIGNTIGTVVTGFVLAPVAHDPSLLYPYLPTINKVVTKFRSKPLTPREIDPTCRLRGWAELGKFVGEQLPKLRPGAFIMTEDYQRSSEMAFYVPGQPKTYCCATYLKHPRRTSQFDMWPDRQLDPDVNPSLVGKDCVYVGFMEKWPDAEEVFGEHPVRLPDLVIKVRGYPVASFQVWLCRDFKGMKRRVAAEGNY